MSDLVEKVARAIKDNAELDEWDALTPTTQAWYVAQARAATREVLAALREPSAAMKEAASGKVLSREGVTLDRVMVAMLDTFAREQGLADG